MESKSRSKRWKIGGILDIDLVLSIFGTSVHKLCQWNSERNLACMIDVDGI